MHNPVVSQATLIEALDRFSGARVMCVGDVMLDTFIYGQVDRISPEAPIPVFSIREERAMLGGAGNVARNLTALGVAVSFVSVVGHDKIGRSIMSMIGKEQGLTPYLLTESERVTTQKTRYVAGSQQVLRADQETLEPVLTATRERIINTVREEIAAQDVLIISDYGKGVCTRETVHALIDCAKSAGKPVVVDPKSRDFSMYRGATCISPNLLELGAAAARELKSEDDIIHAAQTLMATHDFAYMLVTRGRDGMTLFARDGGLYTIGARAQQVFDVSGAGDTAIATLAVSIAAGLDVIHSAALANVAAGIVVGRLGTAVVTTQDLRTTLTVNEKASGVHKIMPQAAALAQVAGWKREGKTIGFTNGCFDLMHPGHLVLLQETKSHCDRLVVGLNSDDSVKRLKGASRPINGEVERALLLASLAVVDMVVIFEEDTPLALIEALRPDVLAKGSDYEKHQVVGHESVEAHGGKILLVPLKEGYSTTNLIKKMA